MTHPLDGSLEAVFDGGGSGQPAQVRSTSHEERLLQVEGGVLVLEGDKETMAVRTLVEPCGGTTPGSDRTPRTPTVDPAVASLSNQIS